MLRERGVGFDIIEYLKTPLVAEDLGHLLDTLACDPGELVRKDSKFEALDLDAERYGTSAGREDVIRLLIEHPALMTRPIALLEGRAIFCRPAERILELID